MSSVSLQRSQLILFYFSVDFKERRVTLDDEEIRLQIWDTAGQERFRKSMVAHYYRNAAAVVFVTGSEFAS